MKKIVTLLLAMTLVCGALTGCGGASKDKNGNDSANTTSSGKETNSITVGLATDLDSSLDPYQITAAGTREVLFNVYEGLVKPDKEGNFVPALASDYELSDDGLTYTFTIRDDVKFHNGKDMTISDVLYSFKTCAANTVIDSLKAALSDVKVEDAGDNKLTITIPQASGDFISYVSSVYIVPEDYKDQATAPCGTGPFAFESRSVQENLILKKNADYYGTPAFLDQITYRIFKDTTALMTAMSAGSIDCAGHLTIDQVNTLPDVYQVLEGTSNLVQALYVNNKVKPFDDVRVRQALCYATDVDSVMEFVNEGHGTKTGSAMYPAFGKYFDESLSDTYEYNVEKAKELLKEAGYENGFSFTIKVPSSMTVHVTTAEVLVEQLKEVGINADIDQIEWSSWLSDVYADRNYEATIIGFDAATLTASAMLERYTSAADKNMFNYSSEEYDAVYAQAVAETDDAKAAELYKQCEKILAQDAAADYLMDIPSFVAMFNGLEGYEFYPLYVMDFSTVKWAE